MTSKGLNAAGGMGLDIPVVGHHDQETLAQYWATSAAVEEQVTAWGLGPLAKPATACPVLTAADLTSADTQSYTEIYARVNEWFSYSVNVLARVDIVIAELDNNLKQLRLRIKEELLKSYKAQGEKKPSDKTIDDYCHSHPSYVVLLHTLQQKRQQHKLVNSRVEQLDRDVKLLSRQVTIRQGDFDNRNRGDNLNRSPGIQAPPGGPYYGKP